MKLVVSSVLVLLLLPSFAFARDWGNSNNLFIKKDLNKHFALVSRGLTVSKNDMSDIFFGSADVGLRYKALKWLSLDVAYRAAWFDGSEGWGYENRPLVNINLKKKWHDYFLSHRTRFEFRFFQYRSEDHVRLRSEYRIITPFELTRFNLKPYIEEEFFYNFSTNEVNTNWLSGGLRYKINKNTNVKVGYRWHYQKIGETWIHRNVLVTGLLFQF